MIAKTFEIRDRATFIPVLAVKLEPGCEADRYLISRAGFSPDPERQSTFVLLAQIYGGEGKCSSDIYYWGNNPRTFQIAHNYIIKHFDSLESGAVVDVEFILGETSEPKQSERLTTGDTDA